MDIQQYISSGIIELYVMDLCTEEEKKELDQLRSRYPELAAAIVDFECKLENRMMQSGQQPGPGTDIKILDTLDGLGRPVVSIHSRQRPWWKIAVAASLLLMMTSVYFNYSLSRTNKKQEALIKASTQSPLPATDYAIMTNPSITPVAMYGVGSHSICRCTMFWDKSTGKIYIMIHHLPRSSEKKDYQLWARVGDKMVSVGIIQDEIRGRFIEMDGVPGAAVAFTVTLENAGGNQVPDLSETYLEGKI